MSDECIFCHCDPYHYVDIGVGFQAAAVTCCELGVALYQHGDEEVAKVADRIEELEGQLKTVLDRETSILRYYDAKIDEAYAKLADAVEDFETIADTDPDGGTAWFHEFARTTLAKIKGEQP